MGTQLNSLKISQLKALALDFNSEDVLSLAKVPSADHEHPVAEFHRHSSRSGNSPRTSPTTRESTGLIQVLSSEAPIIPSQSHQSHAKRQPSFPSHGLSLPHSHTRIMVAEQYSQSDGDTQPLSPRVYEEFASRSKISSTPKQFAGSNETTGGTHESTARTYLPGQIGHVDLIGAFEQAPKQISGRPSQEQDDEDDPLSQGAEVRAEIYPEANRFQAPKTPATNGKVRNRMDNPSGHRNSTPRLPRNPFAGQLASLDVMDASQAFKATQAVSSPLIHVLHSDGLSERPSPDMYGIQRPATAGSLSSPTRMTTLGAVHAVIEPQTTYISMQESQAARENRLRQAAVRQQSFMSASSDDEFDSDDSQLRRRRLQRSIDLKAKGQFRGVTAPLRSGPSRRGRGQGGGKDRQRHEMERRNARVGDKAGEALIISDDPPVEGNITEDETDQELDLPESEAGEIDELADDNKENVEIPRTVSKHYSRRTPRLVTRTTPHRPERNTEDPLSLEPRYSPESVSKNQVVTENLQSRAGTRKSAIADSHVSPVYGPPWKPAKVADNEVGFLADPRIDIPQSPPIEFIEPSLALKATVSTTNRFNTVSLGKKASHMQHNQSSPVSIKSSSIADKIGTEGLPAEAGSVPSSSSPIVDSTTPMATLKDTRIYPRSKYIVEKGHREQDRSEEPPHSNVAIGAIAEGNQSEPQTVILTSSPHEITSSTLPSEIPETNSAVRRPTNSNDTLPSSKMRPAGSSITPRLLLNSSLTHASGESTAFETAQTSPTNSSRKLPLHQSPSKTLQSIASSGQSSIPSKTFGQIAADPSPFDHIGDIDLDINLLSNEDVEFQNVINGSSPIGPATKRRRGNSGQVLAAAESRQEPRIEPKPGPGPGPGPQRKPEPEARLENFHNPPCQDQNHKTQKIIEQDPSADDELGDDPLASKTAITVAKLQPLDLKISKDGKIVESKKKSLLGRPRKGRLEETNKGQRPSDSKDKAKVVYPGLAKSLSSRDDFSNFQNTTNAAARDSIIVAPNRVFAYFNGNCAAFYPATCSGVLGGNEPKYKVCFDDGTVDTISEFKVKRLELRLGDHIKVDTVGSRTKTYVVQKLSNQCHSGQGPEMLSKQGSINSSGTDIYGHATVLATLKGRQSGDTEQSDGKLIPISIADIYLTQGMWTSFKDRPYSFASYMSPPLSRLQTPSITSSVSSSSTSRDRRPNISGLATSRYSMTKSRLGKGIFKNMVFAVTNISHQVDRDRTTRLIVVNGGNMLADGFNELFDIPELELISASTPSPKKPTTSSFGLTQAGKRIGFVSLIADKHCRKAKYIQALALGIPCLATRWVQDCVTAQRVLPWEPYLLSSGESSFLGGAVRSRMLPAYSPTDITLPSIFENRPKLLAGESVLLVMSKTEEETMKNHPLFTHALGASKVSRVTNLEVAAKAVTKAYVNGEPWDWLYSHDNEKQAEKIIFGSNSGGRKRKRVWDGEPVGEGVVGKRKTRVVGNEFVVQSLILGRLVDLD